MTVNWEKSNDTDFYQYILKYSDAEDGNKIVMETLADINTTSYAIIEFDPTKENWYFVEVIDTLGQSSIGGGKSNTVKHPPDKINISSIEYNLAEMIIKWVESYDQYFVSYELLSSTSENGNKSIITTIQNSAIITETITNFDPRTEMWYWIEVKDYWGQTTLSDGYRLLEEPPIQSEFLPIVYTNDSFNIAWSKIGGYK